METGRANSVEAIRSRRVLGAWVLVILLSTGSLWADYTLVGGEVTAGGGTSQGSPYTLYGGVGGKDAGWSIPATLRWATAPYATGSTTVTMKAAQPSGLTAPIQYYFEDVNTTVVRSWSTDANWTETSLSPGQLYHFHVKAKDASGKETFWSMELPARTLAAATSVPAGSAEPVSGELGSDIALGIDPFTGSVSYSVPIAVPAGRQGSEPKLSLNYGGGGNGWCGVGWSVGMGAISRDTRRGVPVKRSGATFYSQYDDAKGFVVAFGSVSSRLVQVADYGNGQREFRAETDQAFLKYVYNASANTWTVTDKSGNKFYFGESSDGRMINPKFNSSTAGDNTFAWVLEGIQDINGNLTDVDYVKDANQIYLSQVAYNGHTYGSVPATHTVEFETEDRTDRSFSYATGYRIENNKRLKNIRVKVSSTLVRRYALSYTPSPSTMRSLLTEVKMYGSDNTTYLQPVTFNYTEKPFEFERDGLGDPVLRDWGPLDMQGQSGHDWASSHGEWGEDGGERPFKRLHHVNLIDINGDGLPDRVMVKSSGGHTPPSNNMFKVQFNTGSGFSSQTYDWGPLNILSGDSDDDAYWASPAYMAWPGNEEGGWGAHNQASLALLADMDGDGLPDRLLHRRTQFYPYAEEYLLYDPSTYLPSQNNNYFSFQRNTGFGFERTGSGSGAGSDYVTRLWGPLDAQGYDASSIGGSTFDQKGAWWDAAFCWNSPSMSTAAAQTAGRITLVDLNGDGLPDRVMTRCEGQPPLGTGDFSPSAGRNIYKVQFNTGQGFERTGSGTGGGTDFVTVNWGPLDAQGDTDSDSGAVSWNSPSATESQDVFVALADINGDGLPDRVMRKSGSGPYNVFRVQFNTGYGFERTAIQFGGGTDFTTRDWGPLNSQGEAGAAWNSIQGSTTDSGLGFTHVDLFDINGDGLPDRVMRAISSPYDVLKVELNTGTGFTHEIDSQDITWLGVSTNGHDPIGWHATSCTESDGSGTVGHDLVTMADMNGDGLVDRVLLDTSGHLKVQLSKGPLPDMLRKVTGSLGGTAEVGYTPSTQYDNRDHAGKQRLPMPVYTASALTIDDGMGNRSTTAYAYERGCFDGQAREFRGFGKVTVTDPMGAKSITYFHQGGGYDDPCDGEYQDVNSVAKKGMPYRVEVYGSDNKLYALTLNKVAEAKLDTQANWYYAYVSQTTKLDYSGIDFNSVDPNYTADYRAKVRRSEYDLTGKTGNILKTIDIGEVRLGEDNAAIKANLANHTCSATPVDPNDDLYIHTEYETFANTEILNKIERTWTTSDYAGSSKLKEIKFTYDSAGRVLTEQTWLDRTASGPINGGSGTYTPMSVFEYDSYGNIWRSTDKAGIRTEITYDGTYHMYPEVKETKSTDSAYSQAQPFVTRAEYSALSGLPVRTWDPAGMVGRSVYDVFFRVTDSYSGWPVSGTEPNETHLTHIDYNLGGIANGISTNYIHQIHTGYEAYTYSDGLGRVIQKRVKAETGAGSSKCRVANVAYDGRGNVSFEGLPYFGDGNQYDPAYVYKVYLGTNQNLTEGDLKNTQTATTFVPGQLAYSTTYYWKVVKEDANDRQTTCGPWSFSTASAPETGYREPDNPPSSEAGLRYEYFEDEEPHDFVSILSYLNQAEPEETGLVNNFDLSVRNRDYQFVIRYSGYINISATGEYTFYVKGRDNGSVYIGDTQVAAGTVNILRNPVEGSGKIKLKHGKHSLTVVAYTGILGSPLLEVRYSGPQIPKQLIPNNVLYRATTPPSGPSPYNGQQTVNVACTLDWSGQFGQTGWADAQLGQTYLYDHVGRQVKTVQASGDEPNSPTGESTVQYIEGPYNSMQVFTDPNDKVTKKLFDAAGRMTRLIEVVSDGNDVVVDYEYDRLGRLVRTIDPNGNQFLAEYDSLGRKIRSIDPDMGTWTYAYDTAGRMSEQVDSRGDKVTFDYNDVLGRVHAKKVYNSSQTLEETTSYVYDTSDDPDYRVFKGQVYKVTDGQGWTKTGYDAQGRAIKATRYLSVNTKQYTTQTAYDDADRVTQVTYPNNRAVVAYSYDTAGHQVKAESLWGTGLNEVFYQVESFNRFGRPQQYVYGNGVTTQHEFYPISNRLRRVHTYKDATNLMDLVYTFDEASNIRNVFDELHPDVNDRSLGLTNIVYDDLYRIKSAQPGYQAGQLNYTYDAMGNIVTNGELGASTYVYGSSKPHAVTQVGSSTYGYDACGNMTARNRAGKDNQSLTYDAQNRLTQVVDGNNVQFGYSAGDSRLWKKFNGQVTGLWIGSLYEEKDGKVLCHVYADGQIVASFEPEGYFACTVENQPILAGLWHGLGSGWYVLFGDNRMPVTVMCGAALAGIVLGLRYNRRRLLAKYGIETYYGIPAIGGKDPWRQMVLLCLAGSVFLSSVPQSAFADSPTTYDPVFYYYHADHLGSSSILTDRYGNIVQRYGYTPFGKERVGEGISNGSAFKVSSRYTGQTLDEDTGLYYYGARYYDPEIARFIQADTVVPYADLSQAYNRYAYCANNPIKFTDPTGHVFGIDDFIVFSLVMSSAMGGVSASANGGSFLGGALRGLAMGCMSMAIGAAVGGLVGQCLTSTVGQQMAAAMAAVAGGAASWGFGALVNHGQQFTFLDACSIIISAYVAYNTAISAQPGVDEGAAQQDLKSKNASIGGSGAGGTSEDLNVEIRFDERIVERVDWGEGSYQPKNMVLATAGTDPLSGDDSVLHASTLDKYDMGKPINNPLREKLDRLFGRTNRWKTVTRAGADMKNVEMDVTLDRLESHLLKNGWQKVSTRNPQVVRYLKNGREYVLRPFSSDGSPTAEFFKNKAFSNSIDMKIRLATK